MNIQRCRFFLDRNGEEIYDRSMEVPPLVGDFLNCIVYPKAEQYLMLLVTKRMWARNPYSEFLWELHIWLKEV